MKTEKNEIKEMKGITERIDVGKNGERKLGTEKREVRCKRYEARSCWRSSPDSLAF